MTMRNVITALVFALAANGAMAQVIAIVPDPTITPGAVRTTDAGEICAAGTRALRHWSRERDDRIMGEYGLSPGPHPDSKSIISCPWGSAGRMTT